MTKAHILQEIKRTAKGNGGAPLGTGRFEQETGIKTTDWNGKFWARWGDALREAGFAPNKLQGAREETELLDKYAKLAQELGRLPVKGEINLKARSDSKFPWNTTFDNHFGTKRQLVIKLLAYCKGHSEYADVVHLSEEYTSRNPDEPEEIKPQEGEIGFVYLLKSGRNYKIGKTNAAGRRHYELSIQLPERATTVHIMRTDDPLGIEAYWHGRFAEKRKNGEWFELNAADIAAFKRRKFM